MPQGLRALDGLRGVRDTLAMSDCGFEPEQYEKANGERESGFYVRLPPDGQPPCAARDNSSSNDWIPMTYHVLIPFRRGGLSPLTTSHYIPQSGREPIWSQDRDGR